MRYMNMFLVWFYDAILALTVFALFIAWALFRDKLIDLANELLIILGFGIIELGFYLVGLLLAFSLICPLLEIAENTRVLRDAVESGDLKLTQSDKD